MNKDFIMKTLFIWTIATFSAFNLAFAPAIEIKIEKRKIRKEQTQKEQTKIEEKPSIIHTIIKWQQANKDFKVKTSVIIAMVEFESNHGKSKLAVQGNNFLGIKARGVSPRLTPGSSKYVWLKDDDYIKGKLAYSAFKKFNTLEDCLNQYKKILEADRYKNISKKQTAKEQLKEIRKAGYATAPTYATQVYLCIKKEKLEQYDN